MCRIAKLVFNIVRLIFYQFDDKFFHKELFSTRKQADVAIPATRYRFKWA